MVKTGARALAVHRSPCIFAGVWITFQGDIWEFHIQVSVLSTAVRHELRFTLALLYYVFGIGKVMKLLNIAPEPCANLMQMTIYQI